MKRTQATGIYQRGEIYWLNFQKDGVRQFVTLETSDFSEAITRANEIRLAPNLNPAGGFEAAIQSFLAYKLSKKIFTRASADSRGFVLRAFAARVLKPPESVTLADVQAYYDDTLKAGAASTAATYALILSSFFEWSISIAKTQRRNPCDELDRAKDDVAVGWKDFCSFDLRDKLISECADENLRFVLFCGFHAGLRKNEIIEAPPFWFDIASGLLHLRKTPTIQFKDREERTIPLTKGFLAFLKDFGLRAPFMLHPEVVHGKSRYRYDFIRPFREYMEKQGCPWVTPHIMRHTFASLLASRGVSLYKIAKWLGDSPKVVETRYAKLTPNDPDIERAHDSAPPVAGKSPKAKRSQH